MGDVATTWIKVVMGLVFASMVVSAVWRYFASATETQKKHDESVANLATFRAQLDAREKAISEKEKAADVRIEEKVRGDRARFEAEWARLAVEKKAVADYAADLAKEETAMEAAVKENYATEWAKVIAEWSKVADEKRAVADWAATVAQEEKAMEATVRERLEAEWAKVMAEKKVVADWAADLAREEERRLADENERNLREWADSLAAREAALAGTNHRGGRNRP